jgi:hypothetical protein
MLKKLLGAKLYIQKTAVASKVAKFLGTGCYFMSYKDQIKMCIIITLSSHALSFFGKNHLNWAFKTALAAKFANFFEMYFCFLWLKDLLKMCEITILSRVSMLWCKNNVDFVKTRGFKNHPNLYFLELSLARIQIVCETCISITHTSSLNHLLNY